MSSLQERFDDYCHEANSKGCENCQYDDGNHSDLIGCAMNFAYQQGREDERTKVIDEILFRISKITTYYAGDKDGKAITPVMFIRDEVVKTVEQMRGGKKR